MDKSKVIIMSVETNYTLGYTEDGQFIKLPKKSWHQVGQIINTNTQAPAKKNNSRWQVITIAASILLLIFSGIVGPFFQQKAVAEAYISMALNNGNIEMWVDSDNKVIEAKYSSTFKELAKKNIKGQDLYLAVETLASEAKTLGILTNSPNDLILVDLVPLKEKNNHHIEVSKLEKSLVNSIDTNKYSGLMFMSSHDKDYMAKAQELNLTVSQYHVYETSTAKGYKIESREFKHGHMHSVLNKAGITPEELFDNENHHTESMMPDKIDEHMNENINEMEQYTNSNMEMDMKSDMSHTDEDDYEDFHHSSSPSNYMHGN